MGVDVSDAKISAQEFADKIVDQRYRQPVKSLTEALTANGWEHIDRPMCCGHEIDIRSMIGAPYFAQCKTCGKFVVDVCGPSFANGSVRFVDTDKVDVEDERTWIAGQQPAEEMGAVP